MPPQSIAVTVLRVAVIAACASLGSLASADAQTALGPCDATLSAPSMYVGTVISPDPGERRDNIFRPASVVGVRWHADRSRSGTLL